LAGSFNGWARNSGGRIKDQRFAMYQAAGGLWYKWVDVEPGVHHYKYVVERTAIFDGSLTPM
jgi:hypothetical protein